MDYQQINKQNIEKWIETLKYLTKILDSNHIPYYLSASGLHFILGSNIYPYDIDLFVSEDKYLEFQGVYNGIPFEICQWEKEPKEIKTVNSKGIEIKIVD